jgi:hypothetical protein
VVLSDWGNVTVNGVALQGDTAGPGAGRLWITGALTVTAAPLALPLTPGFPGQLQTTVTLSGSMTGYANANPGQPVVFTSTVSGAGTLSGTYRAVDAGGGVLQFVNTCCLVIQVGTP